ncbi:rRNA biogenesis protein RRP5 [Geopyxis carbonaria]|nr:rRNA biogenesis protein RRP5 [Geopyxis carbonaria]
MAPEKKRKRAQDSSSTPKKVQKEPKSDVGSSHKRPKTAPATSDAPVTAAPTTLKKVKDDEATFPRGGAQALTPLEYKEVANEAAKDVLFEAGGASAGDSDLKMSKKKSKRTDGKKDKKTDATPKETGPKVEGLSFKKLVPGALVLGCIQKINKTDIALSLPNNLTGFISITQISDKLTSKIEALAESESEGEEAEDDNKSVSDHIDLESIFRVGQYLRACVLRAPEEVAVKGDKRNTQTKTKKRIGLSIYPSLVNTGLSTINLPVGSTVQAAIASIEDHGLVMDLGLEGDVKGFLSSKELGPGFTISKAQEGQVIFCTVTGRSSNGKIVKLSADLEQKFSKKGKLASGKANWWLADMPSIDMFLPGTGVEVLVTDIKQGGIVGKIMGMLDAVCDFFHAAGWEKDLEKIQPGTKIKARITSTVPDSDPKKVTFSILPHILSLVSASETDPLVALPIGTIIESAKIVGVESRVGLFMDIGVSNVPGFVHISRISSESRVEDLVKDEGPYKIGATHAARVLGFNVMDGLYILSTEKRVIEQPYLRIEDIDVGAVVKGKVEEVLDRGGLVIKLADGISGLVEETHVSDVKLKNPEKKFRVGTDVRARVLATNPGRRKLHLTLKKTLVNSDAPIITSYDVTPGTQTVGTLISVLENGAVVKFYSGVSAFLPVAEMSEAYISDPREHFRVGQSVNVFVLSVDPEQRKMRVSCKDPGTIAASKDALEKFWETLYEGKKLKGYVQNTADMGIFVTFPGGVTGLALKRDLPDEKQSLPDFGYLKQQSVTARVKSIDLAQKKFLLSLRPDEKKQSTSEIPTQVEPKAAINAVDGKSKTVDDYVPGKLTKAKIISVQETQINVQLADNIQGRVDVSQLFDSWDDIKNKKEPLGGYKKGEILKVRVIGIHDARNHRFLAITHRTSNKKSPIFELTAKPRDVVESDNYELITLDKVVIGSTWLAFVNNITPECVWVNISPGIRGRIRLLDLSDDVAQLRDIETHFPIGSVLKCHVVKVDEEHGKLDLSAKGTSVSQLNLEGLSKGMVVPGRVNKVMDRQAIVQLGDNVAGIVNLIDIADDFSQAKMSDVEKNSIIRVCVINVDKPNKRVTLSMRPSRTLDPTLPIKDPEVNSIHDIKDRELRRGFVKNVSDKGLFVSLGLNVTAWVKISDLSDRFVKDWKPAYEVGQVVEGRIIAVDPQVGHVQMSLRPSAITGKKVETAGSVKDYKVGQIVTGKIQNVAEYGVFVVIDGTKVSGLCHKSQIADREIEDISKLYETGDPVKAKILKIDVAKRRISFGLKASYFEDLSDDEDGMDVDEDEDEESDEDGGVELDLSNIKDLSDDSEDEGNDDGNDDVEMADAPTENTGVSTSGFSWDVNALFDMQDEESEEEEDSVEKIKRKKKRRAEIQKDLTGDMMSREPQNAIDYERLVLGDPNESKLWIQYMAFHLQLNEIERAREIAERALNTISQRQDDEKRNVWVAMLNMENTFGDDDTLEETFKRAIQYNDSQDIHERLASIYIQSGKTNKADEIFKSMIKKFSQVPKIWVNYGDFLLSNGNRATAREMLKRAMQALPKDLHRDLIIKYASMEFRTGDPERGRTLFENMIGAYAKRMDIWNVFLDMEMKHGGAEKEQADQVRGLFKRAIAEEKCTPKQASLLFRKWKEYEEKVGNAKSVADVMERAKIYVAKQKAAQ